jgi:hypothetical protein
MATAAQRHQLARVMDLLYAERARVHYRQVRPMQTRRLHSLHLLQQTLYDANGVTMDCSEAITLLCHVAGLDDPNGFGYDGHGFTGTLLHHLPHYSDPRKAGIGALVVFGPGSGDHVCMVRRPGANPTLFSHGSERGPIYITLADEKKYQRPPTIFLSIAKL